MKRPTRIVLAVAIGRNPMGVACHKYVINGDVNKLINHHLSSNATTALISENTLSVLDAAAMTVSVNEQAVSSC